MCNRTRLAFYLTLAVFFGCRSAWAADVITTDPNTPSSTRSEASTGSDDTRLAQKITYSATHQSVLSILNSLSSISGVKLNAGWNSNDWQVRDRRMNIYAKDVPLADLMNSIASVMKFKWSKNSGSDPPSYRLYMDREDVIAVENRSQTESKKYAEKREAILKQHDDASKLPADALSALKKDNPYLYTETVSGAYDALKNFFDACPSAKEAYLTGQEVSIAAATLPENARNALYELLRANWKIEPEADGDFPENEAKRFEYRTLVIEGANSRIQYRGVYKTASGELNGMMMSKTIYDPQSDEARVQGLCHIAFMEGQTREQVINQVDGIRANVRSESRAKQQNTGSGNSSEVSRKNDYVDDFGTLSSDDPELKKQITLKIDGDKARGKQLSDYLRAVFSISGSAIVSDSFLNAEYAEYKADLSDRERELREVMDKISRETAHKWQKRGSVIEFRDNDWYKKRSLQIPDAWIDKWKSELINDGTLSIKSMAEIATLTKEQFDFNFRNDEVLRHVVLRYPDDSDRAFLKFYYALDDDKLGAVKSATGLDISLLGEDEMSKLTTIIKTGANHWILERILKNPGSRVMLVLQKEKSEHFIGYKLCGLIPGEVFGPNVDGRQIEFGGLFTPVYEKPKSDE